MDEMAEASDELTVDSAGDGISSSSSLLSYCTRAIVYLLVLLDPLIAENPVDNWECLTLVSMCLVCVE